MVAVGSFVRVISGVGVEVGALVLLDGGAGVVAIVGVGVGFMHMVAVSGLHFSLYR